MPCLAKVLCTSHCVVNEESCPWFGDKGSSRPLTSTSKAHITLPPDAADTKPGPALSDGLTSTTVAGLNQPKSRKELRFCNLFSGKYSRRSGGLPKYLRDAGWDVVDQVDNSPTTGGGWDDDVLNDEKYAKLKLAFTAGAVRGGTHDT